MFGFLSNTHEEAVCLCEQINNPAHWRSTVLHRLWLPASNENLCKWATKCPSAGEVPWREVFLPTGRHPAEFPPDWTGPSCWRQATSCDVSVRHQWGLLTQTGKLTWWDECFFCLPPTLSKTVRRNWGYEQRRRSIVDVIRCHLAEANVATLLQEASGIYQT